MSDEVERELIEAMQGDREALQRVAQRLRQGPEVAAASMQAAQEQFDAAVRHRAQGLAEKNRFEAHYPDVCEDPEQYAEALRLDAEVYRRNPEMSERDRFTAV